MRKSFWAPRRGCWPALRPRGLPSKGAQISCGQRAAPGAIERIRIDPVTLEPRFRVIGSELWSDEPGFDAAVAATGVTGICGSGIIEVIAEMYLAGIINQDGLVDGGMAAISPRVRANGRTFTYVIRDGEPLISITQNDVRAIQLAKAALYAGVRLLMDKLGLEHVDRIRLAGAFGSHIDVKYAMILGLIPDCALEHVAVGGQRGGHRCAHCAPQQGGARRNRSGGAADREDRNGGGAKVPAAFRRSHGHPAQDGALSQPVKGRDVPPDQGNPDAG